MLLVAGSERSWQVDDCPDAARPNSANQRERSTPWRTWERRGNPRSGRISPWRPEPSAVDDPNDAFNFYGGLRGPSDPSVRDSLISRFDLDPSRRVRDMSTGNRRKVGLILAFMSTPQLLILDEPTSGLDPVLQEEFRDLLAERKADGATIWLTSHVMAEVARVADRVGLINDGKIVKELTSEELRHQATTGITFGFEKPVASGAFDGVASVTAVKQDGTDMVVSLKGPVADVLKRAAELDVVRVETEQNDLDAIFIHLLSGGDSS